MKTDLNITLRQDGEFSFKNDLDICCEYDTEAREIDKLEVRSYNGRYTCFTYLTEIFENNVLLSKFINSINWEEIYNEKKLAQQES